MVEEVLPRSSRLVEPAVANVTHVLLVFSAALPPFQPGPATRYLLSADAAGLPVTLVLNKADLLPREEMVALLEQVLRQLGARSRMHQGGLRLAPCGTTQRATSAPSLHAGPRLGVRGATSERGDGRGPG